MRLFKRYENYVNGILFVIEIHFNYKEFNNKHNTPFIFCTKTFQCNLSHGAVGYAALEKITEVKLLGSNLTYRFFKHHRNFF